MSTKYKILDKDKPYFITFSVVNWIDVFSRKLYRDILLESLAFCQKEKGLELFAYCIMSNHVHMIVRAEGKDSLQGIIRDFKKYTSAKILKVISENQHESRKECLPAGRQGCFGCLAGLEERTPTTKIFNSGSRVTIP